MNTLLILASDFLERLADEQHGCAINDAYAGQLERILDDDKALAEQLRSVDASDVWTLSAAGWWWFLHDAERRGLRLEEEFLAALFAHSRSPLLRYKVIEMALSDQRASDEVRRLVPDWLEDAIMDAVAAAERGNADPVEELLRAFLQDGGERAQRAFALVLNDCPGDVRLRMSRLLEGLDDEQRSRWLDQRG